jgi:hypothetical protein
VGMRSTVLLRTFLRQRSSIVSSSRSSERGGHEKYGHHHHHRGVVQSFLLKRLLQLSLIAHDRRAQWPTRRPQQPPTVQKGGPRYNWNRGGCTTRCCVAGSFARCYSPQPWSRILFLACCYWRRAHCAGGSASFPRAWSTSFLFGSHARCGPPLATPSSGYGPEHDTTVWPEANSCASQPHLSRGEIIRPSRPFSGLAPVLALSPARHRILSPLSLSS